MTSTPQVDDVPGVTRDLGGLVLGLSTLALAAWTLSLQAEPSPLAWLVGPLWMVSVASTAGLPASWRVRVAVLFPPWGVITASLAFEEVAAVYASPGWWGLLLVQGLVLVVLGQGRFRLRTAAAVPWRPWVWAVAPGVAIAVFPDPHGELYRPEVLTLAFAWCAALWVLVLWPLTFARLMAPRPVSRLRLWIRSTLEGIALLAWFAGAPYILTGQWGLALALQAMSLCLVSVAYGSNALNRQRLG